MCGSLKNWCSMVQNEKELSGSTALFCPGICVMQRPDVVTVVNAVGIFPTLSSGEISYHPAPVAYGIMRHLAAAAPLAHRRYRRLVSSKLRNSFAAETCRDTLLSGRSHRAVFHLGRRMWQKVGRAG